MNLLDEALKIMAAKAFVAGRVDEKTAEDRMAICKKCPNLTRKAKRCKICWCYMEVKTTAKENYNPKKLRFEITHCPAGKWGDVEIANIYRAIDGLEPLKIIPCSA